MSPDDYILSDDLKPDVYEPAKLWLVGEQNPYSRGHDYDLYPLPEQASGGRLMRILGLTMDAYMEKFQRRNLLHRGEKWGAVTAREAAKKLCLEAGGAETIHDTRGAKFILLGAKVARAFGHDFSAFSIVYRDDMRRTALMLPHPSGLSRAWNDIDNVGRARMAVAELEGA